MAEESYNGINPPEISSVMGLVDTYVRWKNETGGPRGYEIYHPSAFGKCLRLMQYQRYEERGWIKGDKEQFSGKTLRLFENGHTMHDRWKNYFEDLGVLLGVWECENPLCQMFSDQGHMREDAADIIVAIKDSPKLPSNLPRIYGKKELQGVFKPKKCACGFDKFKYHEVAVVSEELNFRGHADMLLDFRNFDPSRFDNEKLVGFQKMFDVRDLPKGIVVVDMKTINAMSFQRLSKTGASPEYRVQLTIYINILKCDYGILIYEDKDQFDTAAYKIDANTDTIFAEVVRQATLMNEMVDTKKLPPPRPDSTSSFECKKCAFRAQCLKSPIWKAEDLDQMKQNFYGKLL